MRILIILVLALAARPAWGGSLFARSYYSHEPVRPVQIGPRPVAWAPGVVVRSGSRRVQSGIRDRYGSSQYTYFESWSF